MSKRFKLIFLGENEEYLRDIGCSVDARVLINAADKLSETIPSLKKIITGGGYRGRLRIGSNSLFLDLEGLV